MSVVHNSQTVIIEDRIVFGSDLIPLLLKDAMFQACWRKAWAQGTSIKLELKVDEHTNPVKLNGDLVETPAFFRSAEVPTSLVAILSYEIQET